MTDEESARQSGSTNPISQASQATYRPSRLIQPWDTPTSLPFVRIERAYTQICAGDRCASALLAAFETWTVGALNSAINASANNATSQAGDVWIARTKPELHDDMQGMWGEKRIEQSLNKLVKKLGFLRKRDVEGAAGKRLEYHFDKGAVQAALDVIPANLRYSIPQDCGVQYRKFAVFNNAELPHSEGLNTSNLPHSIPQDCGNEYRKFAADLLESKDSETLKDLDPDLKDSSRAYTHAPARARESAAPPPLAPLPIAANSIGPPIPTAAERAWAATVNQLEQQLDKATFATYVRDLRLIRATEADCAFVVAAPSARVRDVAEHRLGNNIRRLFRDLIGQPGAALEFVVSDSVNSAGQALGEPMPREMVGMQVEAAP